MRSIRAALMPLAGFVAICALAYGSIHVGTVARFDFIWDVLLGAALGALLALLPSLSGFGAKRNAHTSMYWVCGFGALLLIFYQYTASITGVSLQQLSFLTEQGSRMPIVEGAMLGYCSFIAGRGKV